MAVEGLGGGYDGAKADIWSAGVVLFQMLSGNSPFEQATSSDFYFNAIAVRLLCCTHYYCFHNLSHILYLRLVIVTSFGRVTQYMQTTWRTVQKLETFLIAS